MKTTRCCVLGIAMLLGVTSPLSRVGAADNPTDPTNESQVPADNTGRNVRDRDDAAKTADQQSNSKQDVEITRAVRRAIVKDKSLSTSAHNVKIITTDGVVTLRGPVTSKEEKANVAAKTRKVAGVSKVENELEVATP